MNLLPASETVRMETSYRLSPRDLPDRVRSYLASELLSTFAAERGAYAPPEWVKIAPVDAEGIVRAYLTPPLKAREAYLPELRERRKFGMYVTTETKIPIAAWPYEFDRIFPKETHFFTFRGWDLETGLMVFDR